MGFDKRVAALAATGVDLETVTYGTAFGRPLDYYTGLVFEVVEAGSDSVLASDGRVDQLSPIYLPPRSLARSVAGTVDFGVTDEDLVRERLTNADPQVKFCVRLGFGHADVVVAMPEPWLDVDSMADLGNVASEFCSRHGRKLVITTKYWQLTQQFFSRQYGVQLYRIGKSLGATESAPVAWQADIIGDIISTGATAQGRPPKNPLGQYHLLFGNLLRSRPQARI